MCKGLAVAAVRKERGDSGVPGLTRDRGERTCEGQWLCGPRGGGGKPGPGAGYGVHVR